MPLLKLPPGLVSTPETSRTEDNVWWILAVRFTYYLYSRLEKYASTVLVQCMLNMPWTREIWDGNWDRESSEMKTIGAPLGPRTARFTLSPWYLHKVLAECKIERTYFYASFVYSLDLASHSNRYQHFRNHHLQKTPQKKTVLSVSVTATRKFVLVKASQLIT